MSQTWTIRQNAYADDIGTVSATFVCDGVQYDEFTMEFIDDVNIVLVYRRGSTETEAGYMESGIMTKIEWGKDAYRTLRFLEQPPLVLLQWLNQNADRHPTIMESLITDRTQADASYAEKLYKKLWSDFTEQERADFEAGLKGSYKASDLNRVGTALITIRDRLRTHCIDVPAEVREDYGSDEVLDKDVMDAYIESANAVYDAVVNPAPRPPAKINDLDWEGANNVEKTIIAVDDVLESREVGWIYAGSDIYAGEAW